MSLISHYLSPTLRFLVAAAVGTTIAACQGEPDNVWGPDDSAASVLRDLRIPIQFGITPTATDGGGSFAVAAGIGVGGEGSEVRLAIMGGHVELRSTADGLLVLQALEVDVDDVLVGPETLPPFGAKLTGLRASLMSPVAVQPNDDGFRLGVIARLDMQAEWAVELSDGAYPLSPMRLDQVPFSLDVERNQLGDLSVRLVAFRDGPFWQWADRFALADLTVDLSAKP